MEYGLKDIRSPSKQETDCLLVGIYSHGELSKAAQILDESSQGAIRRLLNYGDFTGKKSQLQISYEIDGITAQRVVLVGCGKKQDFDAKVLFEVQKTALSTIRKMAVKQVSSWLANDFSEPKLNKAIIQSVLANAETLYYFNHCKSKNKKKTTLAQFNICLSSKKNDDMTEAFDAAVATAKGIHFARDLANLPANICTPTYLAEQALALADQYDGLDVEILDEAQMEALNMGGFLSVSRGSEQPGKFIVMQYQGAETSQAPIALVGKGITFDSGGISLKPSGAMDEMKFDMGGAASVLGATKACVEMALPINLVSIVVAAENMPGSKATKPGDIVTTMSGQTVEVLNTDAEGRMVLCDALTYVKRFNPACVIDMATLTGACIVALGHHISGLFSNNDELAADLEQAGRESLDPVWRFPMTKEYQAQLKSNFADIPNIGSDRSAGSITAACFLSRFTKDYRWAHLDIAGTAWKSGKAKGGTGRPVALLTQFLRNQIK